MSWVACSTTLLALEEIALEFTIEVPVAGKSAKLSKSVNIELPPM